MTSPHEPLAPEPQYEVPRESLTAEERCLINLFDMAEVDRIGVYQQCSSFFVAMTSRVAPEDLVTNILLQKVDSSKDALNTQDHTTETKVIATAAIGLMSSENDYRDLYNIDFVNTRDGLKAIAKQWGIVDDELVTTYPQVLSETQVAALAADANRISQIVLDTDTERLNLGPLVEEVGQDGTRRFHVGDILSVITRKLVSGRGMNGVYDILGYMTNDPPYTTQLGRFRDECAPDLHRQFDGLLSRFYTLPEEAFVDTPSLYRWLGAVAQSLGDPFLRVDPIAEDQHTDMDPVTELELDHGTEIIQKVTIIDSENPEPEE